MKQTSNAKSSEGDIWSTRPWVSAEQRRSDGRAIRKAVPRGSHGLFEPPAERDPIAILEAQEVTRIPELVPLRHARMAESPFAYYRGTPAVMALDLSTTPRTDILVQASGDAHISNFGVFASPERQIVFDTNDFDETLPAPWEWDIKRLAASVVVAGRANGFTAAKNRTATLEAVRSYRESMAGYAGLGLLDAWYRRITEHDIRTLLAAGLAKRADAATGKAKFEAVISKARGRDSLKAASKLTEMVDGRRVIVDDPPTVEHVDSKSWYHTLSKVFGDYQGSLDENRRHLLERYKFVDFAQKVVGVGSVGTPCFIVVLQGRDEADILVLQAKEATASVLEPYVKSSLHGNHGQRVVAGQRLMQTTPDIFLGWTRSAGDRDYYFRQLWDMKGSFDTSTLLEDGLAFYGSVCGWALARAHARAGDPVAIAGYLGRVDSFDGAIADFAETYADQNETDYAAFKAAIKSGRVEVSEPAAPAK